MNTRFILALALFAANLALAQEGIRPLHTNFSYIYPELRSQTPLVKVNPLQKIQSTSLFLPFVEDFYYAQYYNKPSRVKWMDSSVYVNTGYPVNPPSIGVGTLDGLNKFGYPYEPNVPYPSNLSISHNADTLTSRPINLLVTAASQTLQLSDSVGLSFYFESAGFGDPPEVADSLILDFYSPLDHQWVNAVWAKVRPISSNPVKNDSVFMRAFVMIDTVQFLQDSFQFRFRNKATTTGNFDHWHLDYIKLDRNQSVFDTVVTDLTFAYVPYAFLRDYYSMPWEQYTASEMAANTHVKIKNNGLVQINMSYQYTVDSLTTQLSLYQGNQNQLLPFRTGGYSTYTLHATPAVNYTFQPMTDSVDYTITHSLFRSTITADDFPNNDTVVQYQRFRNFYALDDGSAEGGYFLNKAAAKMAIKVNVNAADSFLGERIYFDPEGYVGSASNNLGFRLVVWAAGATGPGVQLFRDTIFTPAYFDTLLPYASAEFKLIRPKLLTPGTYYIGLQQLADPDYTTIGFDFNTDHHTSFYYDVGAGWVQSGVKGSIMIHPIFGRTLPHPVGIAEISPAEERGIVLYPNPTSNRIMIHSTFTEPLSYKLTNTMGQTLLVGKLNATDEVMDTSSLPVGIYFMAFSTDARLVQQQKIIIQR